jgi:hypothetical protein
MSGNHQVRFLGEDAAARPPPYPTKTGAGIHEQERLKHLSRMHEGQRQCTDGHEIDPDRGMFRIEAADHKVFTVQTG